MSRWLLAVLALLAAASLTITETARAAGVAKPRLVRHIATGETGWFSSPSLVDLNGDRKLEIVAPAYSTFVFDAQGRMLGKGTASKGRVYAPSVVADLDGDGAAEIVVGGNDGTVAAYDLRGGALQVRPGWPASTCSGGQCPETRGLAAADLDGDGRDEVVATTTNTSETGSQVFVFDGSGRERAGLAAVRRERRRRSTASATTATGRSARTSPSASSTTTRSSRSSSPTTTTRQRLQPRRHVGARVPWYTNRESAPRRRAPRLGPVHPVAEPTRRGRPHAPPHRRVARHQPQRVAAVDRLAAVDRRPRPRRRQRGHRRCRTSSATSPTRPRRTRSRCWTGRRSGGARSARRHRGFERMPLTGKPAARGDDLLPAERHPGADDREHPRRPPAGDRRRRARRARVGGRPGRQEAVELRLRPRRERDVRVGGRGRRPQPRRPARARLRDLRPVARRRAVSSCCPRRGASCARSASGTRTANGNGVGIAAAPSIADIDGDGRLEIVVTTIDHGIDVYRVPRSDARNLPWPTGRGGVTRTGSVG